MGERQRIQQREQNRRKWVWLIPAALIAALAAAFLIYAGQYYRAGAAARSMLESDETVSVTQTDYGWLFDGPSETDALIFYPGAKVEASAYAPLLHGLAENGMDVCLVKMPFHFAFFGMNKADKVMAMHDYEHWYIGGHSLGGAMAAYYAAGHAAQLTGVILLAAYPTKPLADNLKVITIYGSEDGVLNMDKVAEGEKYMPKDHVEFVIPGGNHAQFGDYGEQKGDGTAAISAQEQQRQTLERILQEVSAAQPTV